jgi:hypothetical protein
MKFIRNDPRLSALLAEWAKEQDLRQATFYFWSSGSLMQMSRLGLFQTLVHTCLQGRNEAIIDAFPERWKAFVAFGGGRDPFDWPELRQVFMHIISDQSTKFFFLIDGLDEFEGEPREIIDLILKAAQRNVKLCVASRPWLPFEDAFKHRRI